MKRAEQCGSVAVHATNQAKLFGARRMRCRLQARAFCSASLPCWRRSLQHTYSSSIILISQLSPVNSSRSWASTRWLPLLTRLLRHTYHIISVHPQQLCDTTCDSVSVSYRSCGARIGQMKNPLRDRPASPRGCAS